MANTTVYWFHSFRLPNSGTGSFVFRQIPFFKENGILIETILLKNLKNPFCMLFYLFKNRKRFSDNIVHAQFGSGLGFVVSLFEARKKLITIRGSDWHQLKQGPLLARVHSRIARLLTRISLSRYDYIITVSKRMKAEIVQLSPKLESRVICIPTGIDLEGFYKTDAKKPDGVGNFTIGISSVLLENPVKRVSLARAVVREVKKKHPHVRELILSNIPPHEMNMKINECDLLLLTSQSEGWPNIIKEGLACEVPFVATDVSDLREIASIQGSNCQIADDNVSSFVEAIEQIFGSISSQSVNLRDFVRPFDLKLTTQRIVGLYSE